MRNRIILAALIAVCIFSLSGFTLSTQRTREQWEHKRVAFVNNEKPEDVTAQIDALGFEGWELVQYDAKAGSFFQGLYLFKRRR